MNATPPWLAAQASQLLTQRGHAWLLAGPSGLGQYDLALALASAWLCEHPSGEGACGQCGSCHAVSVRTHADLCVLMPESLMLTLAWPLGEKAQAELDSAKRKPSKEIKAEAMRDAIEFSQRTSARGRGKVVLVYPAERMNAIAANTLLLVMIRRGAVARTAALLYLMPPLVALQAWLAFDETLGGAQLGGMALAVLGVALVTRR